MNRYIDADWLLNFFELYPDDYQIPLGTLRACVDDAPTIDTVNMDRCKCDFGKCHEQGDTLYESSDWDGGIGFDYIRDIKYCPLCGGLLDG